MTEILNCNFKNGGDFKHYRTVLLRFNNLDKFPNISMLILKVKKW